MKVLFELLGNVLTAIEPRNDRARTWLDKLILSCYTMSREEQNLIVRRASVKVLQSDYRFVRTLQGADLAQSELYGQVEHLLKQLEEAASFPFDDPRRKHAPGRAEGETVKQSETLVKASAPEKKEGEASATRTVLIVEDDHQQRTMLALMLEKAGYTVLEAAHPSEAASCWKKHKEEIEVVVADIWLPGIPGPELVSFFRREKPGVKSVFISGMSGDMRAEFTKSIRTSEIVRKPFSASELLGAIERVMSP